MPWHIRHASEREAVIRLQEALIVTSWLRRKQRRSLRSYTSTSERTSSIWWSVAMRTMFCDCTRTEFTMCGKH